MRVHEGRKSPRRVFLKSAAAGMLASTIAPRELLTVWGGSRLRESFILGKDNHTYEWVRDWIKLPTGMKLGSCHGGIVFDSHGLLYLNTETENAVMVFDSHGHFVRAFGSEYKEGSHGMMIRKEGRDEYIYITHQNRHEVIKLTLSGEQVWSRGFPQESGVYKEASEYKPTAIAFAPNGDFYVADGYGKAWVHHYNAKGDYLRSWGGKGSEPGRLNNPHGIWVDTRRKTPVVVVADRGNHRLQLFNLDGEHQGFVTEGMRLPSNMDQRGTDLAVADLAGKVTILDKDNNVITDLGKNNDPQMRATNKIPPDLWKDGVFISPHCVRWDRHGNLYVHEWLLSGRVTKLRRSNS